MTRSIFRGEPAIASFQSPNRSRDVTFSPTAESAPFGQQEFNIRMANSEGRREAATMLLRKMYAWRGYAIESQESHLPNLITLTADTNGETVGTMTLCFDSEFGLPADETFHKELEFLRSQSRLLCEPTRLAVDKDTPKRVLAAMWHISYIYCHKIHHYTDYIIEVNPRHAVFYKRMLGFEEFGAERQCMRVNAPAVLLRLECQYIASQVKRCGGLFEKSEHERSFYPHCFSTVDEIGIHDRLVTGRT